MGIIVAFQDAIIIIIDRFAVLLAYTVSVQTHFLAESVFQIGQSGLSFSARTKLQILTGVQLRAAFS